MPKQDPAFFDHQSFIQPIPAAFLKRRKIFLTLITTFGAVGLTDVIVCPNLKPKRRINPCSGYHHRYLTESAQLPIDIEAVTPGQH
ncbi:hypothetical protein [Psychromonas sp. MB-3u-54]|uniref:hypothetical protein n=1 Tax=Psychromonas sp. MB-3u-54 TaxID=2058319 RepID=UPI0012FEC603|nr:hypothetical protein [Psychromonas sp. MB-3u-54]